MNVTQEELATIKTALTTILKTIEGVEGKQTDAKAPITLATLRAELAAKSKSGYAAAVKELLASHGAERLSALADTEYEAVYTKAKEIGKNG